MNCKLQVFTSDAKEKSLGKTYRFAVVDNSKSKFYPENFICMLPIKVQQGNHDCENVFGKLFGADSLRFALKLLNDALNTEQDTKVKAEIGRRINLIDPKQIGLVKCSVCKKSFQPITNVPRTHKLCIKCQKRRSKITLDFK
jgi:hypothetical protein